MVESDCKLITEKLLGEKWHISTVHPGTDCTGPLITCSCGAEGWPEPCQNRTFQDPQDFFACFEKLVELRKWLPFENSAYVVYEKTENIKINDLRHDPSAFTQWLLSRTESGHYRLCVLCAEALKEGVLK
jgi:hypothetical protein